MATLSIINNFEMAAQGHTHSGKQGTYSDSSSTAFELTASTTPAITGLAHSVTGSLATATWITLWDDDNDYPADFDYLHFWADQDCYLQFVGTATNFTVKVAAKVPFTLSGFDELLAAASTTDLSAEPTMESIDHIMLGNHSGSTLNYRLTLVD